MNNSLLKYLFSLAFISAFGSVICAQDILADLRSIGSEYYDLDAKFVCNINQFINDPHTDQSVNIAMRYTKQGQETCIENEMYMLYSNAEERVFVDHSQQSIYYNHISNLPQGLITADNFTQYYEYLSQLPEPTLHITGHLKRYSINGLETSGIKDYIITINSETRYFEQIAYTMTYPYYQEVTVNFELQNLEAKISKDITDFVLIKGDIISPHADYPNYQILIN